MTYRLLPPWSYVVTAGITILGLLAGCVTTGPKFSSDIQQSYRHHDMRRMVTDHLHVYYPAERNDEARYIAANLERCFEELDAELNRPVDWGPVPVFLPEVEFNNAYAAFGAGNAPHVVMPTFFTANIFGQFGYTPSVSAVGCHEMVHYVHFTQVHGMFRAVNDFFGPSINPQTGLDLWFFEGLATYYESQLVEGVGRFGSPIWENVFAAGVADTSIDGGRLSELDRSIPFGAHYLVGSHFVAFLVDEYGEEKLWELIDMQGESVFFPFAVSNRFQAVYGHSLAELIERFDDHVGDEFEARDRPEGQHRMRFAGKDAQLEVDDRGTMALYSSNDDTVAAIEVIDEEGEVKLVRKLADLWPGRELVSPRAVDSLRFSEDGRWLYFIAHHRGRDADRTSLMRLDVERNRLETVRDDIQAAGGDLIDDGDGFLLARADGDRVRFERLGLDGEPDRQLFTLPRGAYVGWVRACPRDQRVAVTLMENESWSVAVFSLDDGEPVGRFTTDEAHRPAFDPVWVDDDRLMFAASHNGRVQLMRAGVDDGEVTRLTDVPYMAFNPRISDGGNLMFLNREGWGWSLDRVDSTVDEPTQAVRFEPGAEDVAGAVAGYPPPQRPVHVYEDEPYSQLDGLFTPRLRVPSIVVDGLGDHIEAGLGLAGRDELGFHNWMVNARWDFSEEQLSGSFGYVNTQLAPWTMSVELANEWMTTLVPDLDSPGAVATESVRDRFVRFEAFRPIFDNAVWFEAIGADLLRDDTDGEEQTRRLVGAELGGQYLARRSTAYGGDQWLLGITGEAGGFPRQFGSDFSMGHLRSQLEVHTPLPLSDRHRLRMSARGRSLPGAPADEPLMRVGGFTDFNPLLVSRDRDPTPSPQQALPLGFLFVEPLRGYEDAGMVANQIAIADIDYRYPLIVDRGTASTLRVFPSVFLREFDIQLFASGATRLDGDIHAAAGASVDIAFAVWRIPFRLRNQVAHRLVDDRRVVFTLSLGAGFGY